MSERDRIQQLLYRFEHAGLIAKDIEQLLQCFSSRVLGIGMGEQGFVTSLDEVRAVIEAGVKTEDDSIHMLDFGRVEILQLDDIHGIVCAEVRINSHKKNEEDKVIKSQFQQSLTVIKEDGEWKICGLHASIPDITEEYMEAYPLKIAEKTLCSLREKIGNEVYLVEEQYRKAVLADTVAFYIINFSNNCFEKCQVQGDICANVEDGTPYQQFVQQNIPDYVYEADRETFLKGLSLHRINEAYQQHLTEVSCEYRMRISDGTYIWMRTIIRLITDIITGDKKGIMYVKNIDDEIQEAQRIRQKADYDSMTNILNKGAMMRNVDQLLKQRQHPDSGSFLMIDVDDFKTINDTFGHPVGDLVLIAVADQLEKAFGPMAVVGRLGGDEFGVFLPGESLNQQVEERVEHLIITIRSLRFVDVSELKLSISIGASGLNGDFEELYREADAALYQAKKEGKNRAVFRR